MRFSDNQIEQLKQLIEAGLEPLNKQLRSGEKRMDVLAGDITELGKTMVVNNVKTEAMFNMFDTAQKGLRVLGSIGNGVKWAAGIVAAVVAAWAAFRSKR